MTQNQIAYMQAVETKRHNQEMERLEGESQQISRTHYERSDTETARSNRAKEALQGTSIGVDYARLAETQRSNLAYEAIGRENAAANYVRAQSSAYLDYATAGLRFAETGLADVNASYTVSRTNLTDQQTRVEAAKYYNELANYSLTQAQTERVVTETELMPLNTASNLMGGAGRLFGSLAAPKVRGATVNN